ncbi:MAG: Kelch repeat-containing protein [Candidatus Kapaibacterium sp.]
MFWFSTIFISLLFLLNSCHSAGEEDLPELHWKEGASLPAPCEYCLALSDEESIYILSGDESGTFQTLNIGENSWTGLPPLPLPRTFPGGAILGRQLYVAGGIDTNRNYSASVDIFSLAEQSWRTAPPLSKPRSRLALIALGGKLYAIGGLEGASDKEYQNSPRVEVYDPENDSWSEGAPMPTPRHGLAAIATNGKILVMGGYSDSGITNVVEEYDPKSNSWAELSPMPTKRGFFGLAHFGDLILAIGGRVQSERGPVEAYNPREKRWVTLPPLPIQVNRFGIATCNGTIYLVGGEENPKGMLTGSVGA